MSTNEPKKVSARKLEGVVTSDKMDKTVVVKVESRKRHPKYKRYYTRSVKYKVHDPENRFHEGDVVLFVECRPLSKDKRWRALYK